MMHPFRLVLLVLCCVPAALPVWAAGDVSECVFVQTDLDRLACYDRISGYTPKSVTAPPSEPSGNWVVRSETSDFKDTVDVYMSVQSEKELPCGMLSQTKATLMVRCKENTTSLFLSTSCHVASGFSGYGRVEYRVDDQKSQARSFDASTNNRALGLWRGSKSIPVIKSMLTGETLLMRFTPFNENAVTARFDITGLDSAIAPLRKACSW